jgi:hypothetical protein
VGQDIITEQEKEEDEEEEEHCLYALCLYTLPLCTASIRCLYAKEGPTE